MRPWLLLAMGCSGAVNPSSPDSSADVDEDGWTARDGDCDDLDPLVNPDGADFVGDGIDQDCDGSDASILMGRALAVGDLRITEVQKDPIGVAAVDGEWFELRNDAAVTIDLLGLSVRGDAGDQVRIDGSVPVEPGGYVVLGTHADLDLNGEVVLDHAYGTELRLGNASGRLELGVGVDTIAELRWNSAFPNVPGRAMQLSPAAVDPILPTAWCAAETVYGVGGWGSPGEANPPCPDLEGALPLLDVFEGEIVITEIFADPEASDDGEWVEIFNNASAPIDLFGLELVDEDGDGIQVELHSVLAAGEYAVFAASDDPDRNGDLPGVIAAWGDDFGLRNESDTVVVRFGTREFDRVEYDVSFPSAPGVSIQTPPGTDASANNLGAAWCLGTVPFGDGDRGSPAGSNTLCL